MSSITAPMLVAAGADPTGASRYARPLAAACAARGIVDAALAPFLANALHESGGMSTAIEDTYYSTAKRIYAVFPSHFRSLADAATCVASPQALAQRVYGGWQGRGLAMLTGLANCAAYAKTIGMPVSEVAAYLETPEGAADSAAWFYVYSGCLPLGLAGNLLGVTRKWEGGTQPIGWASVQAWAAKVARAMPGPWPVTVAAPKGSAAQSTADALMDRLNPVQDGDPV